jgi:chaperone required for assembly of F1-ATPase
MSDAGRKGSNHREALERSSIVPARITDSLAKPLVRRFYKDAGTTADAPFQILLDGRAVKTPKKRPLSVPTRPLAEAIAAEWLAQETLVDPARMPLTRFANTAIDAVNDMLDAIAADIVAYAGSDLLCYRAVTPEELKALQAALWDPIVAWGAEALGARLRVVSGVMPIGQPEAALKAVAAALEPHDAFRLTGLHVLTTLTGSALLALALARRHIAPDAAWTAAHVDEDYQISLWGEDEEAAARRRAPRAEFDAAIRYLMLLAA